MSKVPAHWELMDEIVALRDAISPSTLLVGNGDVLSREQGLKLAKSHKLDGIMIGRGIFNDPKVFMNNSDWSYATKQTRIKLYRKHVELFASTWQNNERRIPTLNKFCKVYIQGFDGAKELRERLMSAKTTIELTSILNSCQETEKL